jgi:hypothetical protein
MSWDKNTIMFSDITPITRELIRTKEKYQLFTIGKVKAMGLNDLIHGIEEYDLRILIYKGGVVVEQVRQMLDCDVDDVIVSETFNFDELPEKWPLIRNMDCAEYVGAKKYEDFVSLKKYKKFVEEFIK